MNRGTRRSTPNLWLPAPVPAELLRELAQVAIDAAQSAGADYADVRVGVLRYVKVPEYPWPPDVGMFVGYGIRGSVNGTWSFQHGEVLTTDAIAMSARSAVEGARLYSTINAQLATVSRRPPASAWAPVAPAVGVWHAPMEIDPFDVPIDDYHRAFEALQATTAPVEQNARVGSGSLDFQAETRVFASTAGSLVTQTFVQGGLGIGGGATLPENRMDYVDVDVPGTQTNVGGFEIVLRPDWIPRTMAGVDEAIMLRELPFKPFTDVGRFPIVFGGRAFASLVMNTVSLGLDGERAAGLEADASGTTFLAPIDEVLGTNNPQFSPLLTVRSSRKLPAVEACGWDDEGVAPEDYTLVERGRVVDYHTTRETAPLLAEWYAKHNRPIRSHGTTVASLATYLPIGGHGHLQVQAAAGKATMQDLYRDISHGFVVREGNANSDMSLTGGTFNTRLVLEIKNGTPVCRTNIMMQFTTKRILQKQLVTLGDASTARTEILRMDKGVPWQGIGVPVTAPAAFVKDVDVVVWDQAP